MTDSFLWYDLETFGINPRSSRISQFAAQRTDLDLNLIDEPISLFCQPSDDFLPDPEAALITGITPQYAKQHGICEADFLSLVHDSLSQPGTCALGYNSIRFDDEFIRFGLYRNFFDAYEREYAGGNSRWDLLDVMRMVYALRPNILQWPLRDDGMPSFKLEHLAKANNAFEGSAHEALSDVRSLINMAGLIKNSAPDLWQYALSLRDKNVVANKLSVHNNQRILHVSGQFPATQACTGLMLPLMIHPHIKTRTIAVELRPEALKLIDYSVEQIEQNIFTKSRYHADDYSKLIFTICSQPNPIVKFHQPNPIVKFHPHPEEETRIGLKEIHHNRCPIVFAPEDAKSLALKLDFNRLNIDIKQAQEIHAKLHAATKIIVPKLVQIFKKPREFDNSDPDAALYSGFFDRADKAKFSKARSSKGQAELAFNDARLSELYFRYKARNWPKNLNSEEILLWQKHKAERLRSETVEAYFSKCDQLIVQNPEHNSVLQELKNWAKMISSA